MSCLYILEIKPLSVTSFTNIFSHSFGWLFVLLMVSFALQKLLSLVRSHAIGWIVKCTHTCNMGGLPILWSSGKESTCWCRRCRFNPWVEKIPWRKKWQPIPVFLPGKLRGQMSLVSYSPRGHKELNTTEWLSMHAFNTAHTLGSISTHMFRYFLINSLKTA